MCVYVLKYYSDCAFFFNSLWASVHVGILISVTVTWPQPNSSLSWCHTRLFCDPMISCLACFLTKHHRLSPLALTTLSICPANPQKASVSPINPLTPAPYLHREALGERHNCTPLIHYRFIVFNCKYVLLKCFNLRFSTVKMPEFFFFL